MSETKPLILGEFSRKLDERYRLSLPEKLVEMFQANEEGDCIIAKERPGCVSLWSQADWAKKMENRVEMIQKRLELGDLEQKIPQLQMLGRLLSTRHRPIQLAGRGRLLIPEGFREFLKVEAGGEVMVVGAAVCIEIWNPEKWIQYVEGRMPKFRKVFDKLSH